MNWKTEAKRKGEEAEEEFKKWLDEHKINYLYIKQGIKSFPKSFSKELKRPDFIILLPDAGLIMVDVKRRDIIYKYNDIAVDIPDLIKFDNFQRKFHIPIWYAFSNENLNYEDWFWIPLSDVIRLYKDFKMTSKRIGFTSSKSKKDYYPVKLDNFIKVNKREKLIKIFSKSF